MNGGQYRMGLAFERSSGNDARSVLRRIPLALGLAALTAPSASCGGSDAHPVAPDEGKKPLSVEMADFEVNSDGIDRFASCPPAGELGQAWMPPLPEWTPTPVKTDDAGVSAPTIAPDISGRTPTERAIEDTRASFRSCYHRGLVFDPTQNGHVGIVVRVGPDGRVQKVESYAACEIAKESVACMRDVAKALRFPPPRDGADTLVLPVVFAGRSGMASMASTSDAYTAGAYVALEEVRPELHACLDQAKQEGKSLEAWGHFDLTVDANGHVQAANIDPWGGDQDLLSCAATVMDKIKFPPPGGTAKVLLRVRFNPRGGL